MNGLLAHVDGTAVMRSRPPQYGPCAKSVALRYPEPEFQAKLLLTQMAMEAAQPDPRD